MTKKERKEESLKDPMSGYASGDALDPKSPSNQPHLAKDELLDPMSGYASADVLDPRESINRPATTGSAAETKDPMSGYASADAISDSGADVKPAPRKKRRKSPA